jgi:hypothetical protein
MFALDVNRFVYFPLNIKMEQLEAREISIF